MATVKAHDSFEIAKKHLTPGVCFFHIVATFFLYHSPSSVIGCTPPPQAALVMSRMQDKRQKHQKIP